MDELSYEADNVDPDSALIVGRQRELGLLRRRLTATLAGRGGVVLIGGEAGIGKTTLVGLLYRQALERGAQVLTGHCYDLTATPPYGPWLEMSDRYPAGLGVPELPDVLRRDTEIGDLSNQLELFEVARSFFANLSASRPLVLVLEDLHWSDPASLDLLRYLARHLQQQPMLLVATYRADEVTAQHPLYPLLPLLVREADAERLDLRQFGDADVRALVDERYRLIPLATTLDHVGPLTRTVRDAAIVLQAISGHDKSDTTSLTDAVPDFVKLLGDGPVAMTIGVDLATYEANVDPDIFAAVQQAIEMLRELGATIVPVRLPDVEQAVESIQTTLKAEAAYFHRRWLNEDAERYSPAVRARLEGGMSVLAIDYLTAFQHRSMLCDEYLTLLETADVLLTPTTTRSPMTVTELEDERPSAHGDPLHQRIRFTGPINATGLPALSVPCGVTDTGIPIGMQLVGRPLDEGLLLTTADRYERAAGWSARHPQLQ